MHFADWEYVSKRYHRPTYPVSNDDWIIGKSELHQKTFNTCTDVNINFYILILPGEPWNCSIYREIAQEVNTSQIHDMGQTDCCCTLLIILPVHKIYILFLQDYKESPVSSHRPPVSVSSCPLLRLHAISQSFNSQGESTQHQLSVYSSAQLVAAFCLKTGHIFYSDNRRLGV